MSEYTVKGIIEKYLRDNGYDGLCGNECGCGLDDLAPCCDNPLECIPAYKVPTPAECVETFGETIFWPKKEPPTAEDLDGPS